MIALTISLAAVVAVSSCNKEEPLEQKQTITYRTDLVETNLPISPFDYTPDDLPAHFTDSSAQYYAGHYDTMPSTNPTSDAGATLGRVLFYDTRLSANDTVSCASCHKQSLGFSDDAVLSEGFQGGLTGRHSMALANQRFYLNVGFFWDERAASLEEQVLMPIQDSVEMGMDLNTLLGKLSSIDDYKILFNEAFGSEDISEEKIAKALAQFVRSMISYQSKFDVGVDIGWDNFTQQEWNGLVLFQSTFARCTRCHLTTLQSSQFSANNGLDLESVLDLGLGGVTGDVTDYGKFKIPSLRNIAVTGPYMHDGRFETLTEVIEHYSTGIQLHPYLDDRLLSAGMPVKLNLQSQQIESLVAFLNTLTDEPLLTDEKFSNPF